MKEHTNNIQLLLVGLIIGMTQAAYLIKAGGVMSIILSFLIFLYLTQKPLNKTRFNTSDYVLFSIIILKILMGILLLLFGNDGDYESRNLFLLAIIQLMGIWGLLSLLKNENQQVKIVKVLLYLMLIEVLIIFDQFFVLTFSVGFSKISEDNQFLAMLTGSMTNANDSAAYIGIMFLVITAYYSTNGELKKSIIILILAFPAVFLTLSRTILSFWLLNLIAVIFCNKYFLKNIFRIIIISFAIGYFGLNTINEIEYTNSNVLFRSIDRIMSFGDIGNDESIDFRIISHLRLYEQIGDLGLGTFSDLNYKNYFKIGDPWLMTVNPHSWIVEYSFLFGYLGFVIISSLIILLIIKISLNFDLPLPFKILSIFGILFIQAIPSSLISLSFFIMPFILISKIQKNQNL